jgi:hypothetical protein
MRLFLQHRVLWTLATLVIAVTIIASCVIGNAPPNLPAAYKQTGAETHGLIRATTGGAQGTGNIFLPGVAVYLKAVDTGNESPKAITNARGWYAIPHMPPGSYQLCWQAEGFAPGCTPPEQKLVIASTLATPAPQTITPQSPAVTGRVTLAGGRACYAQDPALGLQTQTTVQLLDASGTPVGRPVATDQFGGFIIPTATATAGPLRLRAECDGFTTEAPLPKDGTPAKITFKGTGPIIASLTVGNPERPVRQAAPGATVPVRVAVKDAARRHLHYRWLPSAAGPGFVSQDQPEIAWPLPDFGALNTMQVLVTDEAGGHSTTQIAVRTGPEDVLFSGTVTDAAGAIIQGATVTLNGEQTVTNQLGYFFFRLPTAAPRYILNISHDGYALFSRVLFKDFVGVRFTLAKAQQFTVDPTQPIIVNQTLSGGRPGAELRLPAGALVDAHGNPPAAPVTLYLSTFDLQDPTGRVPGNGAGVSAANQQVRVGTYGGVDVQIRDAHGNPLNLGNGQTGALLIPATFATATGAHPSAVPAWWYDPATAAWQPYGSARLSGLYYEVRATHFSAINVGQATGSAACMVLNIDPGSISFPFNLAVTVPQLAANGTPVTTTFPVSSAATDVLAELPPNEPIVLEINNVLYSQIIVNSGAATSTPPDPNPTLASCTATANLAVAPNAGLGAIPSQDAVQQLGAAGFLDYYGLDDQNSADAYYATIDPTAVAGVGTVTSNGAAVTGSGTAFTTFFVAGDMIAAGGLPARTIAHVTDDTHLTTFTDPAIAPPSSILAGSPYSKVGTKTTLARFQSVNGFVADQAQATYFNANDLGFGRSMHMWKSGGNIFYYVTNYHDVESARLGIAPIATVAMEYAPGPGGGASYTRFYVFNGAGARVNNADLDGNGIKFVPRLCVVCHGGTFVAPTPANQGNMGSRFIAFDLASYGYSGYVPAFSRASQEENFRLLNQGVLEQTNPSAAQQELIRGWYAGPAGTNTNGIDTTGTTVFDGFVPSHWKVAAPPGATVTPPTLYTDVVRTSCRTCHVDRDAPIDWNNFTGGSIAYDYAATGFKENGPIIQPYVCEMRIMPHALVTYVGFWSNSTSVSTPNRLSELQTAGLDGFLPSYACPLN